MFLDCSNRDALNRMWTERRVGVYVGVDPTAPSLHIGHMLPFMVLAWAYVHGIRAVFLVGLSASKFTYATSAFMVLWDVPV